jgi:hypothetical protein
LTVMLTPKSNPVSFGNAVSRKFNNLFHASHRKIKEQHSQLPRRHILVDPARLHLHLRLDHHVRDTSIQPTNVVLRQRAIRLAQHSHQEFPIANATHFSFAPSRNQLSELSHETQQY